VKTWIAEHDGRINAYWEAQHDWNARQETAIRDLTSRLQAVEKRVIWLSAIAAGGGGVLGNLLGGAF